MEDVMVIFPRHFPVMEVKVKKTRDPLFEP